MRVNADDDSKYDLTMLYERGTPVCSPVLCRTYTKGARFIKTLLTKLINVERAVVTNEQSRLQVRAHPLLL